MSKLDLETLSGWLGRSREIQDTITAVPVAGLSAALDHDYTLAAPGEALLPCWHWLYFLEAANASELGPDGHPRRGNFLPPVPLPRRMWAGSRLTFHAPLRVGDVARRHTTIADVQHKHGRSGDLVFLLLQHEVFVGEQRVLEEEQDIVYRAVNAGEAPALPVPGTADWARSLTPDPVLLFRYSALTFNGHRIHYDRDYAINVEGYPSLVVQGPLTATLLLDLLHRQCPGEWVSEFEFRALRPLLEGRSMTLQGARDKDGVQLWALDDAGALAMRARARLGR